MLRLSVHNDESVVSNSFNLSIVPFCTVIARSAGGISVQDSRYESDKIPHPNNENEKILSLQSYYATQISVEYPNGCRYRSRS